MPTTWTPLVDADRFFHYCYCTVPLRSRCADVGVMSAAILDIEEDMMLSPLQAEVLVGSLNVIAAFGGLIAGVCVFVWWSRPADDAMCIGCIISSCFM